MYAWTSSGMDGEVSAFMTTACAAIKSRRLRVSGFLDYSSRGDWESHFRGSHNPASGTRSRSEFSFFGAWLRTGTTSGARFRRSKPRPNLSSRSHDVHHTRYALPAAARP